jgi:hypothetical protein
MSKVGALSIGTEGRDLSLGLYNLKVETSLASTGGILSKYELSSFDPNF